MISTADIGKRNRWKPLDSQYSTEVIMAVKSIVFFGILAVAAAMGLAGYVLFGRSTIVFWSVFGTVLSLFAFASIAAVGWAFDRFDPSTDVPP